MKTLAIFTCLLILSQCSTVHTYYVEESPIIEEASIVKVFEDEYSVIETIIQETIPEMVIRISLEIGLDPNIALALLKEENPQLDVFADHYNEGSGSHDLGLFQLNDRYIYTDFVPRYWYSGMPFDVFDAESNAFVALSHLKYLLERFDYDILNAVRAYNGGATAVALNNLKPITIAYSYRIMETLGYEYLN